MLAYADDNVQRAETDAVVAVHEFRKSIRRCRSMLRMLSDLLPADVYRRLRIELRDIHRATSELRDRDVVLGTLDQLDLRPELVALIRSRVATAEPVIAGRTAQLLRELSPRVQLVARELVSSMPDQVRWRSLSKKLQRTYRRARKCMLETRRGHGVIHDWRKRTKELNYQVELVSCGASSNKDRKLRRRISQLTQKLGNIIDLMVLETYAREHVEQAYLDELNTAIQRRRRKLQISALELGKRLFRRKPKKFAREIIKASKRRHNAALEAGSRL